MLLYCTYLFIIIVLTYVSIIEIEARHEFHTIKLNKLVKYNTKKCNLWFLQYKYISPRAYHKSHWLCPHSRGEICANACLREWTHRIRTLFLLTCLFGSGVIVILLKYKQHKLGNYQPRFCIKLRIILWCNYEHAPYIG